MSAVTLETLKSDFEAAREAYAIEVDNQPKVDIQSIRWATVPQLIISPPTVRELDADYYAANRWDGLVFRLHMPGQMKGLIEVARLYIIARDFGEFDRKRALMLWKLQNGGVV